MDAAICSNFAHFIASMLIEEMAKKGESPNRPKLQRSIFLCEGIVQERSKTRHVHVNASRTARFAWLAIHIIFRSLTFVLPGAENALPLKLRQSIVREQVRRISAGRRGGRGGEAHFPALKRKQKLQVGFARKRISGKSCVGAGRFRLCGGRYSKVSAVLAFNQHRRCKEPFWLGLWLGLIAAGVVGRVGVDRLGENGTDVAKGELDF